MASDLHADGRYTDILCVPGHVSGGKVLGSPLLNMDGQAVFKLAVGVLEKVAHATLAKAGLDEPDIDWLIPHQANIRIMQSTARKLKLSMDKVIVTVNHAWQHLGGLDPPGAWTTACALARSSRGRLSCSKGWAVASPGVRFW